MTTNGKTVFMCMSCGNCERKEGEYSTSFTFICKCGNFSIDAPFAAKIETIGCRSWLPADDNYCEPWIYVINDKHKTVSLGQWGKDFVKIEPFEFLGMQDYDDYSYEDTFPCIIEFCEDQYSKYSKMKKGVRL